MTVDSAAPWSSQFTKITLGKVQSSLRTSDDLMPGHCGVEFANRDLEPFPNNLK